MSSWRTFRYGTVAILVTAVLGAELTSVAVVAPPMIAALLVLLIAAISVDYFGFACRQMGWNGSITPTRASQTMLGALELRFRRDRGAGALRTGATARSLLLALAEHDQLRRAGDAVDFLASDAATRVHRDVVADALRALALAELGRMPEARRVEVSLGERSRTAPVVAYARGRIAELAGQVPAALAHVEAALRDRDRRGAARRDLGVLRARLLVRTGRHDDARLELDRVARGGSRPAVEALLCGDDLGVSMAARQALGLGAVYR